MKFTLVFALFCSFCFCSYAQQPPANAIAMEDAAFSDYFLQRKIPVVTGKLMNASTAELKNIIINYTLSTPVNGQQADKMVVPAADGSFAFQLDYPFPYQEVSFSIGEQWDASFFVHEGIHLTINMAIVRDSSKPQTKAVRYTGKDAAMAKYLARAKDYKKQDYTDVRKRLSEQIYYSSIGTAEKQNILKAKWDTLKRITDEYIAASPSPYAWLLQNEQRTKYLYDVGFIYLGTGMPDSIAALMKQHKTYLLSRSSFNFYYLLHSYIRNKTPMTFPALEDYKQLGNLTAKEMMLIDSVRINLASNNVPRDKVSAWVLQLKQVSKRAQELCDVKNMLHYTDSLFPQPQADYLKFQQEHISEVNEPDDIRGMIVGSMQTPWCKALAEKEYQLGLGLLNIYQTPTNEAAGQTGQQGLGQLSWQTAFGANLYKSADTSVTELVQHLRQSLPGKAIIIDRWATWCGPCIAEMPHARQLRADSKDLPVEFVFLCTESASTENKWKRTVAEKELPGIHILISEALDHKIGEYFSMPGYPGLAFINQQGKHIPDVLKWMTDLKDRAAVVKLLETYP